MHNTKSKLDGYDEEEDERKDREGEVPLYFCVLFMCSVHTFRKEKSDTT